MKIKLQIKSVFGNVLFELEKENNTIRDTVEQAVKEKVDLSYADLSYADLSSANLSSADLSYANLSSANLRSADLRYADLSSADLSSADLSYNICLFSTITDKKYLQVGCIGSSKRVTTYCIEDNKIWCGCFTGTLEEFEQQVNDTHKDNPLYLSEYLTAIEYLKKQVENYNKFK